MSLATLSVRILEYLTLMVLLAVADPVLEEWIHQWVVCPIQISSLNSLVEAAGVASEEVKEVSVEALVAVSVAVAKALAAVICGPGAGGRSLMRIFSKVAGGTRPLKASAMPERLLKDTWCV